MRHARARLIPLVSLLLYGGPVAADVLETRDGRVLEGFYLGGTEQTVRFKAGDTVEVFLLEEVYAVRFKRPGPNAAAKPKPPPRTPPSARPPEPAPTRTAKAAPRPPPKAAPAKAAPAKAAPAKAAPPKAAPRKAAPPRAASEPSPKAATEPPPAPKRAPARPSAAAPVPAPAPATPAPRTASAEPAPAAPAKPRLARVPAGTRLRVRMMDGIDARKSAVGDRFAASLANGLGVDGVAVLAAGTKLYGQIAELRATGPIASRLKLELTQLMLRGELMDIVTSSHQLPEVEPAGPADASTIPVRPGVSAGSVLEFRLLQPFELRLQ